MAGELKKPSSPSKAKAGHPADSRQKAVQQKDSRIAGKAQDAHGKSSAHIGAERALAHGSQTSTRCSEAAGPATAHAAAEESNIELLECLVAAGAKLDDQDSAGNTPLMILISKQRWPEAERLLRLELADCGVNKAAAGTGNTALILAALSDAPPSFVQSLLRCGARGDACNAKGASALSAAIASGKVDVCLALVEALDAKALDAKLDGGKTAFELSVLALISKGVDLGKGTAAMMKTALAEKDDAMLGALVLTANKTLIDTLDIDFKRMVEAAMPHAACMWLKRFEPDPAKPIDGEGNTRLHVCAESGSYELAVELQRLGISNKLTNDAGNSPLHVASKAGNLGAARALVEGGADVSMRNKVNRTPKSIPKISAEMNDYLYEVEEQLKADKALRNAALWDDKMKATQSESAFGVRCV